VVAAVERGMPRPQVVTTFGVSLATLKRWLKQYRTTRELTAKSPPGRARAILPEQEAALAAQVTAHPDATFTEHARLWEEALGQALSQWTLGRAIRRLGWTRKKSRWAPASATRRSARRTGSR
jgi:transposase